MRFFNKMSKSELVKFVHNLQLLVSELKKHELYKRYPPTHKIICRLCGEEFK